MAGDNERELKIRAVADTSDAEAGIAKVQKSLEDAMGAMGEFATKATAGGKAAEAAFTGARDATAKLEVAIDEAKAAGAPVDPSAIAILRAYDSVLAETAALQDVTSKSSSGLKTNFGILRAEGALASEAMGPLGRGLAALAGSGDNATAAISRFLLPLAALAGAAVAVDKALAGLKDRGVDVSTAGDVMGHAMDAVAIAMGGTSKATAEAIAGFEAVQKTMQDVDVTQRDFKSGLDLVAQAGLDLGTTLDHIGTAIEPLPQQFNEMGYSAEQSLTDATSELRVFNTEINTIRLSAPKMAEELVRDFIAINKAAEGGQAGAKQALADLLARTAAAVGSAKELDTALQETYGKDGPKAFGEFSAAVQGAVRGFDQLKAGGLTDAEAFDAMRGAFDKAAKGAADFSAIFPKLSADMQGNIKQIVDLDTAWGGWNVTLDKHAEKLIAEGKQLTELNGFIAANSATELDRKRAIEEALPTIDKMIAALEKQKDRQGNLDATTQSMLQALQDYRTSIGLTAESEDALAAKHEKDNVALGNLYKRYQDLTGAYVNQRAAIEQAANATIAAAERQRIAVEGSIDAQIAALTAGHLKGTVSNEEYSSKVAELQTEEVNARAAARDKESSITDDEAIKLGTLQKKYTEATNGILEQIGRQHSTLDEARGFYEAYQKTVAATSAKLIEEANKHGDAAAATSKHEKAIAAAGVAADAFATKSAPALTGALGDMEAKIIRLNGHLAVTVDMLGKISIGSVPDKGAGGTPGSEGQ